MLEVHNISTFYGEFQAVKEVSLKIDDGELVGLFGPNGHGKSTLLKTLCGLLPSASGTVKFDGRDITKLPSERIVEMGQVYIAEDRHLFPEMTVLENLQLGAFPVSARKKKTENLNYVFELFPKLKNLRNRFASTLSGGEARMLAVGRGLMSSAKFLAIDEPSLGLAPKLRTEVFEAIGEINRGGRTILLVEQSLAEASEFVSKLYLIEDGRIVFEGQHEEALSNEHVRQVFLGI